MLLSNVEKHVVATVDRYILAICSKDVADILEIFAQDATVEDPVGTDVYKGHAAIQRFYERALDMNILLERTGAVRIAANEAAFPCQMITAEMTIDVINWLQFDECGKVQSLRSIWGPSNYSPI